ncbi:MAG: PilZ domain-containing protein [Oleibacter sp.]|nr:PilZ domain-containing protein [Thalassolituus sp.]
MSIEERRRYFRLDDEVILDFETISKDEASRWRERNKKHRNELSEIEHEIANVLYLLQSQNPTVAKVMNLFNRKVNLLNSSSYSAKDDSYTATEVRTQVNLSACGMSFETSEELSSSDNLRLYMQLKPSNMPVSLLGTVVGVDKTDNSKSPFLVRVNFEGLLEAEQELLIQHLFQLQSRSLKARSDAVNDAGNDES